MNDKNSKNKSIEREVLKILASLDDLENIEAGPYFYTRVKQRISQLEKLSENPFSRIFFNFRLGPVLLLAIVCLNLVVMFKAFEGEETYHENREQCIELIAEQYSIGASDLFSGFGKE